MIRNTTLDGKPLEGDGEVFTGKAPLEVLRAMKGASLFSDQRGIEDYIDMVLRNAKMLAGIELAVVGDTPEDKAASLLDALVARGLAEMLDDKPAGPVPVPERAWCGIDAVRMAGLTNMLDRPLVARLSGELGFPEATRWIEEHPKEYAEGVFRGFAPEPEGDQ
jgi:hypothetical protein